jgi:hypothetical protein
MNTPRFGNRGCVACIGQDQIAVAGTPSETPVLAADPLR